MKSVFLLPLLLIVLGLAWTSDSRADSPPPVTAPATDSLIPASPPHVPPMSTVEPVIAVEPSGGRCEPATLSGQGFEPGSAVRIVRWDSLYDLAYVDTATADSQGVIALGLEGTDFGACYPGVSRVLAVEEADGKTAVRAVYDITPLGQLSAEIATSCQGPLTIRGSGFEPDSIAWLMLGDDEPMAHNFVKLGEVAAGADGRIEFIHAGPVPGCGSGQQAVYGWVEGVEGRWKTPLQLLP